MRIYNASNGLPFSSPGDHVSFFQSNHGHHASYGYFADNAMPWAAAIRLLRGCSIAVVDGTSHGGMSDGLRYGLMTWCMVFNQAIMKEAWVSPLWCPRKVHHVMGRLNGTERPCMPVVCPWQSVAMIRAASGHDKLRHVLRRLARYYGAVRPAVLGDNVHIEMHKVTWDDKLGGEHATA